MDLKELKRKKSEDDDYTGGNGIMPIKLEPQGLILKALEIPELFEMILKQLDFTRQKIYRLVSRAWNNEICRLQSKGSYAYLREDKEYLDFHGMVIAAQALNLPSPFQEIFLYGRMSSGNKNSLNRIKALLPITRITLDRALQRICMGMSAFGLQLLDKNYLTLTHLKTGFLSVHLDSGFQPSLPNLHSLSLLPRMDRIQRQPYEDPHELNFFLKLISASPKLKRLEMKLIPCAPVLLKRSDVSRVQNLFIEYIGEYESSDVAGFKGIRIEALKELSINFSWGRGQFKFVPQVITSLERLHITVESLPSFPPCPNVKYLRVDEFYRSRELLISERFPCLKVLEIGRYDPFYRVSEEISPLRGVEEVRINRLKTSDNYYHSSTFVSLSPNFTAQLLQMFPAATSWSLDSELWSSSRFCQVVSTGSYVVSKLKVIINERQISRQADDARRDEQLAMAVEILSSVHLLSELEELELSLHRTLPTDVQLAVGTIEFRKLPKLKLLRILYRELLFIPRVENVIGNIKRVELITFDRVEWSKEIQDSLARMPNVVTFRKFGVFPDSPVND